MSYKKIREFIDKIVSIEMCLANAKHPLFASDHEGYAVLKEEIEEVEIEYRQLKDFDLCRLWKNVKTDSPEGAAMEAEYIERTAQKLACESIQVAAMARKFIKSQRARKYENGK